MTLLTCKELSAMLAVSPVWICKLAAAHKIPHFRLGQDKGLRFDPEEIKSWLETKRNQPSHKERKLRPRGAGRKKQ